MREVLLQKKVVNESRINDSYIRIRYFNANTEERISKPTIFLSHKHDDLKDLRGVIGLLEECGAKIYIDSMDNKMPNQTCGDTAKRIKEIITYCNKFILLATANSIESYWCNWELGFGDTHKYMDNIAIIPMKEKGESDSKYKGNEYLQIYPQIEFRDGNTKYKDGRYISKGYYVRLPVDKENTLFHYKHG